MCLANSRKMSGHCVAGKVIDGSDDYVWLRPVSNREHEEVSEYERCYENGDDPRMLDVIDVPLLAPRPHTYQSENWLLDPDSYWIHLATWKWDALPLLLSDPKDLWIDGKSTAAGKNDKIRQEEADELDSSLRLIHVEDLSLRVAVRGAGYPNARRGVQAVFEFGGVEYVLRVTDPIVEGQFLSRRNADYRVGEAYLTVSLGEPFQGACYKLVAGIMTPEPME